MDISKKLIEIQATLKAPKSQYNSFGKYAYRKAEDILEAVKPLLKEHGCYLTCSDTMMQIGDRYYVKATVTITAESDNSSVSADGYAREEQDKKGMDGSQITGASSSYARKYALNGLFAIDDNQDSDTTNQGDSKPTKTAKQTARQKQPRQLTQDDANKLAVMEGQGKKTKDGRTARQFFIEECQPSEDWVKWFDAAVQQVKDANS